MFEKLPLIGTSCPNGLKVPSLLSSSVLFEILPQDGVGANQGDDSHCFMFYFMSDECDLSDLSRISYLNCNFKLPRHLNRIECDLFLGQQGK